MDSAIWDSNSYCGGCTQSVALETTQNWLDKYSDGFLNCSSQSAAGNVWIRDRNHTAGFEPPYHHQSRCPCFSLDVILPKDVKL